MRAGTPTLRNGLTGPRGGRAVPALRIPPDDPRVLQHTRGGVSDPPVFRATTTPYPPVSNHTHPPPHTTTRPFLRRACPKLAEWGRIPDPPVFRATTDPYPFVVSRFGVRRRTVSNHTPLPPSRPSPLLALPSFSILTPLSSLLPSPLSPSARHKPPMRPSNHQRASLAKPLRPIRQLLR